jgi:hypothetical protein
MEYYQHMNNCDANGCKYDEADVCPVVRNIRLATGNIPTLTEEATPIMQPSLRQVGGDHYKKLKIQPMEYSMANHLDACQHTAIKYITRFRDKGGIADLHKAKHVIDMLIEFEGKGI